MHVGLLEFTRISTNAFAWVEDEYVNTGLAPPKLIEGQGGHWRFRSTAKYGWPETLCVAYPGRVRLSYNQARDRHVYVSVELRYWIWGFNITQRVVP